MKREDIKLLNSLTDEWVFVNDRIEIENARYEYLLNDEPKEDIIVSVYQTRIETLSKAKQGIETQIEELIDKIQRDHLPF